MTTKVCSMPQHQHQHQRSHSFINLFTPPFLCLCMVPSYYTVYCVAAALFCFIFFLHWDSFSSLQLIRQGMIKDFLACSDGFPQPPSLWRTSGWLGRRSNYHMKTSLPWRDKLNETALKLKKFVSIGVLDRPTNGTQQQAEQNIGRRCRRIIPLVTLDRTGQRKAGHHFMKPSAGEQRTAETRDEPGTNSSLWGGIGQ